MPPVGFEPTISAGGRPLTYALDRAFTGAGKGPHYCPKIYELPQFWVPEGLHEASSLLRIHLIRLYMNLCDARYNSCRYKVIGI